MKVIKRILSVISAGTVLLTLPGCGRISRAIDAFNWEIKAKEVATESADIILDCFKTGNSEKLEALFCKNVSSSHDLKAEIEMAMKFIEGNIIDDGTRIGMSSGAESVDNGVMTTLSIHPSIWDIKTDDGKQYDISFTSYLIYEKNPEYVGMTRIEIHCGNNSSMIGEVT